MHGGSDPDAVSLNLIPLMDILICLLFFLMASFSLTVLGMIPTSVPVHSANESSQEEADEKLMITMNIQITSKGFNITGINNALTAEDLQKLRTSIPRVKKELDFTALNKFLYGVKTKYPKSDTVILLPAKTIKYEQLVKTMDATRDWTEEKVVGPAGQLIHPPEIIPLFPKAVVSALL